MADTTTSSDIDAFMSAANNAAARTAIKALGSDPALVTEFSGTRITNKIACTVAQYALIADPGASYPTTEFLFTDAAMGDYGFPVIGQWTADTGSTAATPAAGELRWNNATQTSATALYLDGLTASGIDMAALLLLVASGDKILIQSGAANYQIWTLLGTPSVSSGNWTFPVTLASSAGTGTTGFADAAALIVAVRPVSAGGGSSALVKTAWVESAGNDGTGAVGDITKPYLTLNAALDALSTNGGTVIVGHGSFAAPTTEGYWNSGGTYATTTTKVRANTRILGAGIPNFNSGNTALEGNGTIIQGGMILDNNGIWVENLGIDCGSAVCTASFSSVAQEGLLFANVGQVASPGTKAPRLGCGARNVRVLISAAASARHAVLAENVDGFRGENISTRFGFAGVVIKAINSTFSGLVSNGHSDGGLYIKSNAYAPCYNVSVNGVVMTAISGTGQGIRITTEDASSPELTDIQINGAIANGVTTGVQWIATNASIKRVRIDLGMTGVTNAFTRSGTLEAFTCMTNSVSLRTAPTLLNSWANFGSGNANVEWWIENGSICMEGVIKDGTVGTTIFNLPTGARAASTKRFNALCNNGSFNFGNVASDSSGVVNLESGSVTGNFASIAGSFPL